ncbi:MAG: SpoIIE family protein phosphatase [Verrucomicrobia bacterium]|nr:SpoIIE family protein phosphatase [Verrucomicrobiota bacterium]
MPQEDEFSSTMRINIPPDLLQPMNGEQAEAIRESRPARAPIGGPAFQELLQNIYDAAIVTDLEGNVINANERALHFFRCSREDLCAQHLTDVISGSDDKLVPTILQNLEDNRFTLIQAYCVRKDRTFFPVEISANHLKVLEEDYLSFFIRDITRRREAEERLRTGFNAIQNSASGIAIADLEGSLIYCNPAMQRLWGVQNLDEIRNRSAADFLGNREALEKILGTIRRGGNWGGELDITSGEGKPCCVTVSAAPNLDSDGELTGMVLSLLDISKQKEAQRQLQRYALELSEKNRQLENDVIMAREIQQAVLPREYPVFPPEVSPEKSAAQFAHLYIPSGALGGDFFDLLTISDKEVGIFIADVSGHGMRAALVVATLRGLIEELFPSAEDPGSFLTLLNHAYSRIFSLMDQFMFVTAFYLTVDLETGDVRYANAGHPAPFVVGRDGGWVEELPETKESHRAAIGLLEETVYETGMCKVGPGELLFLYTDGLYEAEGDGMEDFGLERLRDALGSLAQETPQELLDRIVAKVSEFQSSSEFKDDVCLLAMEIRHLLK